MDDTGGTYASATVDDMTVESNAATSAEITADLTAADTVPAAEADKTSKAETPAPAGDVAPVTETPAPDKAATGERNADGTFKPKSDKPKDDPHARVQQAVARQRDAERRAEAAERRAQDLEAAHRPAPVAQPEKPTQAEWQRYKAMPNAPKAQDFDNYEDFSAALGLFIADTRYQELDGQRRQQAETSRFQQAVQQRVTSFTERVAAVEQTDPEFYSKLDPDVLAMRPLSALQPGERPTVYHAIAEEILRSPLSPQFLLHFSAHKDDLQRLATLPPRELTREMAKLELRLEPAPAGTGPTAPLLSQAKPPVRPVTGSPSLADAHAVDEDTDVDTWITRMNAKDRQARRA